MGYWADPNSGNFERRIPWLHPAVVYYLSTLLDETSNVLEFGSGGSTLFFSDRCKTVTSIETKQQWADEVIKVKPPNSTVIYQPERVKHPKFDRQFDIILIDGDPVEYRADYIMAAPFLLVDGGVCVVDNYNRPEYTSEIAWLKSHSKHSIFFDVNPPGHQYACTAFFLNYGGDRRYL